MSLSRRILALAVPTFAALIAHPLMLMADTWVVGRLGTAALAGLGVGSGLLLTVVGLMIFLAYGSTAVVARQVGAGQQRRGLEFGIQTMWLAALIGLLLAAVMWPLGVWLCMGLGAGPEVIDYAVDYLRFSLPGLPGSLVMLAAIGTFRGLGRARTPLLLSVAMAGLNVVLNFWFVFGLHLGIAGAALGTAIAQIVLGATAAGLIVAAARLQGARLRPALGDMRHSLTVGFPLWLRTVALRAALLLTTYVAALQGPAGLAAHHITMNVWGLLAHALDAIAIAGQTVIAQALGAADVQQARASTRLMTRWSVGVGLGLGILTIGVRHPIAAFFATDAEVARLVASLLIIVGATLGLAGYVYLLDGVLIGAGDGPYLAKASLLTVIIYAPLALIALLVPTGVAGMAWLWVAFTCGFMGARAIMLGLRARSGLWMR